MIGSVCGSSKENKLKKMTQGSDDRINVTIFNKFPTQVRDLSTATEIEAVLPASDAANPIVKRMSTSGISLVNSGKGGQIVISIPQADLNKMIGADPDDAEPQSFIVWVTDPADGRRPARLDNSILVYTDPFPGF